MENGESNLWQLGGMSCNSGITISVHSLILLYCCIVKMTMHLTLMLITGTSSRYYELLVNTFKVRNNVQNRKETN